MERSADTTSRHSGHKEWQRSWSPCPPSSPGIYLFCSQQGAPLQRYVVEYRDGRYWASPIGDSDWHAVRSMPGWWCLENETTGYVRHRMESEYPEPELMSLEWLL